MFTNRRPYYGLKTSTTDFFREPVRFLKESNTQESMMEKPYLVDEYPKMHLKLPDFKFKPKEIPSIFGPIADGDPYPGLAMIDYGEARCHWDITRTSYCIEGPIIITMTADYFWHVEFNFVAAIAEDTIGASLIQLAETEAGARDKQNYLLTFPENATGSITVCGFASAHVLVSQTFETVVAGMPVGIHLVGGALLPIEKGQSKPATLLQSVYGDKGDDCGCIEFSSQCACDCKTIGYTTQQMMVDEVQSLTVIDPVGGCTYDWSIISGGGSLSSPTGTGINYTAPSSNAGCTSNPTITLSTSGKQCDSLQIAVTAVTGGIAYRRYQGLIDVSGYPECTQVSGTCTGCYIQRYIYTEYSIMTCDYLNFNGEGHYYQAGSPSGCSAWQCAYCAAGETCPGSCRGKCEDSAMGDAVANCIEHCGDVDARTPEQIAEGCCPMGLL